jgi:hypothetical protein
LSFFSSVIGSGFGGGGTHSLKERNGEDSFLSYRKKNLWIKNLGFINPLKESTPILLGQENKLVSVKLHNIHACEILLLTFVMATVVSMSDRDRMS